MPERLEQGLGAGAGWLLRPGVVAALVGGSILLIVVSLALVPALIRRLPVDYLVAAAPPRPRTARAIAARVTRNVVGLTLVLLGAAMLVLPGQGILTIAAGLLWLEFPGRRALLRRIVSLPPLRRAVDALRRDAGLAPLDLTSDAPPTP